MNNFTAKVALGCVHACSQKRAALRTPCLADEDTMVEFFGVFTGIYREPEQFLDMPRDWQLEMLARMANMAAIVVAESIIAARAVGKEEAADA